MILSFTLKICLVLFSLVLLNLFLFVYFYFATFSLLIWFTFRLGCLKGGIEDIKAHAFFSTTDWDNVLHKQDTPPIIPRVSVIYQNTVNSTYFPFLFLFIVSFISIVLRATIIFTICATKWKPSESLNESMFKFVCSLKMTLAASKTTPSSVLFDMSLNSLLSNNKCLRSCDVWITILFSLQFE